jgi:phosphatidylserine decarboxylase
MPLTPYGIRVWLPILIVAVAMTAVCVWVQSWESLAVVTVLTLALLSFFRDPIRRVPANLAAGDMLSPADGTISAVLTVDSHEAVSEGPAVIVRIFLSVLNVHVNRSPCDGEVVAMKYVRGKFLNAQTDESAAVNEYNLITMRLAPGSGETIGVRQVSGLLARTIVCPLKLGDRLRRGQKFGMIMFGSTTELILPRPDDVTVHVKKGDKVRGGLTLLATLGQ